MNKKFELKSEKLLNQNILKVRKNSLRSNTKLYIRSHEYA